MVTSKLADPIDRFNVTFVNTGVLGVSITDIIDAILHYGEAEIETGPFRDIGFFDRIQMFWDRLVMLSQIVRLLPPGFLTSYRGMYIDSQYIFNFKAGNIVTFSGEVVKLTPRPMTIPAKDPRRDDVCYKYYIKHKALLVEMRDVVPWADTATIDDIINFYESEYAE